MKVSAFDFADPKSGPVVQNSGHFSIEVRASED
jgi:hypothetical protein